MKDIYTENSFALRRMIEEKSDAKWIRGEKLTEWKSTYSYLFLCASHKGLFEGGSDYVKSKTYVTPEEFAAECARRFPKASAPKEYRRPVGVAANEYGIYIVCDDGAVFGRHISQMEVTERKPIPGTKRDDELSGEAPEITLAERIREELGWPGEFPKAAGYYYFEERHLEGFPLYVDIRHICAGATHEEVRESTVPEQWGPMVPMITKEGKS